MSQRRANSSTAPSVPRPLDLRGPMRAAAAAIASLGLIVAAAFAIEVEQGPLGRATGLQRTEPVVIRHADAGQIARWTVAPGAIVAPGDTLVQLETRSLDGVIDALKKQIGAVRARIDAIAEEAQAYAGGEWQATAKGRLAVIDAQRVDLEKEEVGLAVTLAMHEQNRARAAIKSPVGGRVGEIAVADGSAFKAHSTLALIVPEAGRVRIDVTWPKQSVAPNVGQSVRVWSEGTIWPLHVYTGTIESVDETDAATVRTRLSIDVRDSPLADPRPREHLLAFTVQRIEQRLSLFGHLFAPLLRSRPGHDVAALHLNPSKP